MPSQYSLRIADNLVTAPQYLIEMGFEQPLYLTSGPDLTWDGHDWKAAPIGVSGIDLDVTAQQNVSLEIANHDRVFGALVMSENAHGQPVKIWLTYREPLFEPMLLADGQMDGAVIGEFVRINVISRSTAYGTTPRIVCAPPLFNHLPAPGSIIELGTVKITIESR
ncbi:MAG: hypothetical protein ACK2UO_02165 [Caldilineaceae bacterium]